ncbi:MAG TPA: cation-translocating P-type ATPase [Thermomicrobiales bacterium]|nr:cation-translocating P-type ATPase [Thermomicrobiales bacterium]
MMKDVVPKEHSGVLPLTIFDIQGMDCGDCARSVERVVGELPGVASAEVNFGAATLTVAAQSGSPDGLIAAVGGAVSRAGFQATPRQTDLPRLLPEQTWWRERKLATTAIGLLLWIIGFAGSRAGLSTVVSDLCFAGAMVVAGSGLARAGWQALRVRRLDMNVLMTISALGAAALGDWSEGAMVVVLFALGGALQSLTLDRTRGAIRALIDLSPPEAVRIVAGNEVVAPVASLSPGDLIRIRPGARVPTDGRIVEGSSAVNQSALTGESLPIDKEAGDSIQSGTINGHGTLLVEVTKAAADSTLARIIHLVEAAQGSRAPSQQLVDRFAAIYTPAVIIGAVAFAVIGSLLGEPATWIYRALVLLVIACPCALVISTPVSIVAAIGALTRRGVLVKGGAALEAIGRVKTLAFDKTGTLTYGRPAVTGVVAGSDFTREHVLQLAASVEALSEHPIARAVVAWALHERIPIAPAAEFQATAGRGAEAIVDGCRVSVGNVRWLRECHLLNLSLNGDSELLSYAGNQAMAGKTPLLVTVGGSDHAPARLAGVIIVADRPRADAEPAIASLRRQGVEQIAVLTGDLQATADAIAGAVGANEVFAELLPGDKAAVLHRLRERFGPVAMIGDGINDAPALATADVGIAMGGAGTDVALETADIVLMRDDLRALSGAYSLSRRTVNTIRQNITASFIIKLLALILAALGFVSLWIAVVADVGASLAVTLNGLRLARGGRDDG